MLGPASAFPLAMPLAGRHVVRPPFHHRFWGAAHDGTNDFASRTSALAGVSASKRCTVLVSVKRTGTQNNGIFAINDAADVTTIKFLVQLTVTTNRFRLVGRNSADTTILDASSSLTIVNGDPYRSFLASFDLASTSSRWITRGLTLDTPTWTTYTNDSIDFAGAHQAVGAVTGGTQKLAGNLAMLAVWPGQLIDLSVTANVRRFLDARGRPQWLGPRGERPFGMPAPVYMLANASGNLVNYGTGGAFTLNGATELVAGP